MDALSSKNQGNTTRLTCKAWLARSQASGRDDLLIAKHDDFLDDAHRALVVKSRALGMGSSL